MSSSLTIFLVFFGLSFMILLHELGHFLAARYFGLKVEEFGFGLPPRLWGKKVGETIYSINWLPFGTYTLTHVGRTELSQPSCFSGFL